MKRDIQNIEDIQLLVNTFYERIRENDLLSPIFKDRIENRWPEHLEKMYRFWQTILLEEHSYHGAPFPPHATMPIEERHFVVWVENWTGTVNEFFEGPIAEEAKRRGTLMAAIFNSKLDHFKKNGM